MLERLKRNINVWNERSRLIRAKYSISNTPINPNDPDFLYSMEFQWFTDFSLLYDHGIFEFKPPALLFSAWLCSRDQIIGIRNQVLNYEQNVLAKGDLDAFQIRHVIYINNILDWVMRKRKVHISDRRNIIAGNFKEKTVFTV